MVTQLDAMNQQILELTKQRNDLLCELRKQCTHLRLVELDAAPPRRICVDCGAEEEGWHCGYHVLVMNGDTCDAPHKNERVLIEQVKYAFKFYKYRKDGAMYLVGQSHPNFAGGGMKSYEQLTEVLK